MVESLREKHPSGQIVRIVIGILPSPIGSAACWRNAGKLDVDRLGMPVDTKPRRRSRAIGADRHGGGYRTRMRYRRDRLEVLIGLRRCRAAGACHGLANRHSIVASAEDRKRDAG